MHVRLICHLQGPLFLGQALITSKTILWWRGLIFSMPFFAPELKNSSHFWTISTYYLRLPFKKNQPRKTLQQQQQNKSTLAKRLLCVQPLRISKHVTIGALGKFFKSFQNSGVNQWSPYEISRVKNMMNLQKYISMKFNKSFHRLKA